MTTRPYAPLAQDADRAATLAHALQFGVGGLDSEQLRRLDAIAQAQATSYGKDLEPHQYAVLETLTDLRHRIAAEQTRRAQQWARIAAQLAGLDSDPDTDQEIPDLGPLATQETDADRAAKLLRAALLLIMGPGPGSNGGGGRPVRPIAPGPTTPPRDGRALSLPGTPTTTRRGDDDIPF